MVGPDEASSENCSQAKLLVHSREDVAICVRRAWISTYAVLEWEVTLVQTSSATQQVSLQLFMNGYDDLSKLRV